MYYIEKGLMMRLYKYGIIETECYGNKKNEQRKH